MWDIYPDYMRMVPLFFSAESPFLASVPQVGGDPSDANQLLAMNREGMGLATLQVLTPHISHDHWVGLRENLQETIVCSIKYRAFL